MRTLSSCKRLKQRKSRASILAERTRGVKRIAGEGRITRQFTGPGKNPRVRRPVNRRALLYRSRNRRQIRPAPVARQRTKMNRRRRMPFALRMYNGEWRREQARSFGAEIDARMRAENLRQKLRPYLRGKMPSKSTLKTKPIFNQYFTAGFLSMMFNGISLAKVTAKFQPEKRLLLDFFLCRILRIF